MMENTKSLIETYYHLFNQKAFNDFINLLDEQVIHHINQGTEQIGKNQAQMLHASLSYEKIDTIRENGQVHLFKGFQNGLIQNLKTILL